MLPIVRPLLSLVTAPEEEPLTTAEAKTHLRVDGSDEDTYIDTLVSAARAEVERVTGRALIQQTWDMRQRCFPSSGDPIEVPISPLQSVESISYIDGAGATQTWASGNYTVVNPAGEFARRGLILPKYGTSWPSTQGGPLDVTVRFVAGYGDAAADVPAGLVEAMRLLIAYWYDNRGTVPVDIPESLHRQLWAYRLDKVVVA